MRITPKRLRTTSVAGLSSPSPSSSSDTEEEIFTPPPPISLTAPTAAAAQESDEVIEVEEMDKPTLSSAPAGVPKNAIKFAQNNEISSNVLLGVYNLSIFKLQNSGKPIKNREPLKGELIVIQNMVDNGEQGHWTSLEILHFGLCLDLADEIPGSFARKAFLFESKLRTDESVKGEKGNRKYALYKSGKIC